MEFSVYWLQLEEDVRPEGMKRVNMDELGEISRFQGDLRSRIHWFLPI